MLFRLIQRRYEKASLILTSNKSFIDWGEIFGDKVLATASLDRLLHYVIVVEIEGHSCRLREHANLVPDSLKRHSVQHDEKP